MIKIQIIKICLLFALFLGFTGNVFASETSGTIVSGGNNGYAWSNQAGWVNFGCSNCGISITDFGITGYAWNNNYGWINMKPTNGGVTVAANGALSGYAWGSSLGWINFSGVSINSSGKFTGQASGSIVGILTFDCTNCSVTTDFRSQNFRATPQSASSGGGGGALLVLGPGGQSVLGHINAFDMPLNLLPMQSGTLTQNLSNQKSVVADVPDNIFSEQITFIIKEEAISPTIFNVMAQDAAGNPVHSFLKPIKITLHIPELLRGQTDLGVYFFDEEIKVWVKIPEAIFSNDTASFYVDHLTRFGIFSLLASEVVLSAGSPSQKVSETGEAGVIELPVITKESPTPEKKLTALFDVQAKPNFSPALKNWKIFLLVIGVTIILTILIYIFIKFYKK